MDLFNNMPESLSPRERWVRNNLVVVLPTDGHETVFGKYKATARKENGFGETSAEAVDQLAHKLWAKYSVKHWNFGKGNHE